MENVCHDSYFLASSESILAKGWWIYWWISGGFLEDFLVDFLWISGRFSSGFLVDFWSIFWRISGGFLVDL